VLEPVKQVTHRRTDARDTGIAVLRLGLGALFCLYGFPTLAGGPESMVHAGQCLGVFGITSGWLAWGALIGLVELLGGIALITGVGVRISSLLLGVRMFTLALVGFSLGETFGDLLRPIELTVLFTALLITGGGNIGLAAHFGWRWLH
jgi:putative oxidoreductase